MSFDILVGPVLVTAPPVSAPARATFAAARAIRERPAVPIMLLANQRDAARRYALLWGAHCVHTSDVSSTQEMVEKACRIAVIEGIAAGGDQLVITAGVPFGTPGRTNLLRIAWVDS